MKYITDYRELHGDVNKSLHDSVSERAVEEKDRILKYLKTGKIDGVRCSGIYDYIKNEPKPETIRLFTDGEYYWDSEEVYHFEIYNIALNPDFVQKVLSIDKT